jgi:glycosyltransferase involved in cell wall biosynthesis
MTSAPSVSVLLPAYNASATVGRAIRSILDQSHSDFELIVIDDGSTDETARIVESFDDPRLVPIRFAVNRGLIAALNFGLDRAKGALIARQDADDESLLHRLRLQVDTMRSDPDLAVVGSAALLRDDAGVVFGRYDYPTSTTLASWQTLFKTPLSHSTTLSRRRTLIDAGGYSPEFMYAEDYELWSRVERIACIRSLPDALIYYNVGQSGISQRRRSEQDATHRRIACANLTNLLGGSLRDEIIDVVALKVDRAGETASLEETEEAFALYAAAFRTFSQRIRDRQDLRVVELDYISRLSKLVRSQSGASRMKMLRRFLPLVPVDFRGVRIAAGTLR